MSQRQTQNQLTQGTTASNTPTFSGGVAPQLPPARSGRTIELVLPSSELRGSESVRSKEESAVRAESLAAGRATAGSHATLSEHELLVLGAATLTAKARSAGDMATLRRIDTHANFLDDRQRAYLTQPGVSPADSPVNLGIPRTHS